MIPRLAGAGPPGARYRAFLDALKEGGFRGDVDDGYAGRVVFATDNSIYQILPQAAVFPLDIGDLALVARLAGEERFRDIVLTPRGGGTGTNGQSLTDGLVVDVSRHMVRILEINVGERWARVQAGVVKDQLNAALAPHGLFFAPELSTSNRATIGGMVATDASGQGSCLYGKTRDHVLGLKSVFLGGTVWESGPLDAPGLEAAQALDGRVGEVHRVAAAVVREHAGEIKERFPKLNRCLTGYDLAHVVDARGRFDLDALLCGAEGTLAFVAEARLNLLPIPKYSALVNIAYASFEDTLRDAPALAGAGAASIETIDSKVLALAMKDIVWDSVSGLFPADEAGAIRGVNLVEFVADDEAELRRPVEALADSVRAAAGAPGKALGCRIVYDERQIGCVWSMRKKAVGLLGNAEGEAKPIPFVEDTAVPPENLADYIMEFRALLDRENVAYGMFGHVDAGVLHVRPAIDMKDPAQEALVRRISDGVVALTRKYKGLLWGEHGKGVRSEYAPEFFGPLYPALQRIKAACDPHNQLNPGKVCTPGPDAAALMTIDGTPTRGQRDRLVPVEVRRGFADAMNCNGNGACFNFDPDDPMCPSWKATRQRMHSPKGRASLVREWLAQLALQGVDPVQVGRRLSAGSFLHGIVARARATLGRRRGEYDFSHEVYEAMSGCLSCKSCATQCPVRVDIPELRSRFLHVYHGRYLRPLKDYVVAGLEWALPVASRFPRVFNGALDNGAIRAVLRRGAGLVDTPKLSGISLGAAAGRQGVAWATPETLAALDESQRARAVVVVQDAFTSYFETRLVLDILELLQRLGFTPLLAPFAPNGKALHVHGFLGAFARVAARNATLLKRLQASGVPLVGVDPAMTLAYRAEYAGALGPGAAPGVSLLQEWLATRTGQLEGKRPAGSAEFLLLPHCTERTTAAPSLRAWQEVFRSLGQSLAIVDSGCCGMAGTYGHEARHVATSRRIYDLSWAGIVEHSGKDGRLLSTGYSCRSQARRFGDAHLPHPAQALLGVLR